jgi:hypothetical protein
MLSSGLERNSSECEPLFLAACVSYGWMFISPPAYASTLVLAAGIARYAHSFFMIVYPMQPFRAMGFEFPLGVTIFLSCKVIGKFRSNNGI